MNALTGPLVILHRARTPVLLSVPHSGRDYPDWLVASSVHGRGSLESLEDPLVDRLIWRARADGIGAVIARAPRAAIDCNRALDDLEPAILASAPVPNKSMRARHGLGLVPSRTQRFGQLWRGPIDAVDLRRRIDCAYNPFHSAIREGLDRIAIASGSALLLDCHSMPSRNGQAELVIGDRFGTSAAPWLTNEAARVARSMGWVVAVNDPYAGGQIVTDHGQPGIGMHALQLEFDRRTYLDPDMRSPSAGFDRAARLLQQLARRLGDALATNLPLAAE